jgi:hypothetical protein
MFSVETQKFCTCFRVLNVVFRVHFSHDFGEKLFMKYFFGQNKLCFYEKRGFASRGGTYLLMCEA